MSRAKSRIHGAIRRRDYLLERYLTDAKRNVAKQDQQPPKAATPEG